MSLANAICSFTHWRTDPQVVELVCDASCRVFVGVSRSLSKPWPREHDRNHHTQVRAGTGRQAALCLHNQGVVGWQPGMRRETVQRFPCISQRSIRPDTVKWSSHWIFDFLQLRKSISTPPFPSKRIRCSQPKVLEQRRAGLERYLQTVFKIEGGYKQVMEFLGLEYQPRYAFWLCPPPMF